MQWNDNGTASIVRWHHSFVLQFRFVNFQLLTTTAVPVCLKAVCLPTCKFPGARNSENANPKFLLYNLESHEKDPLIGCTTAEWLMHISAKIAKFQAAKCFICCFTSVFASAVCCNCRSCGRPYPWWGQRIVSWRQEQSQVCNSDYFPN